MEIILVFLGVIIVVGLIGFVLAIVGFIFRAIYSIAILIFRICVYLFKPAVAVGIIYLFNYLFGLVPSAIALIIIISFWIYHTKAYSLEADVMRVFHQVEMGTFDEIHNHLKRSPSNRALNQVFHYYINRNSIEVIDFDDKQSIYHWTEKRHYPNGVIRKEIHVD